MIELSDYGICKASLAPVRAEASDKSEIVTQLLFGDYVKVLEKGTPWVRIYFPADDYEGWMDFKQLAYISKQEFDAGHTADHLLVNSDFLQVQSPNGMQWLVLGSNLPGLKNGSIKLGDLEYELTEDLPSLNESLTATAKRYLNTPYLWGGKGILGIDCSSLTQMVAKLHGKRLARDCFRQVKAGELVSYSERKSGDLMFFINNKEHIHHVGILLDDQQIIHAAGEVRIDNYDEKGIFRVDFNTHTHHFHSIRRI
ncbi:MAG: C40 family peptidase [Crocinitomicaceae bacterium]